jgi:hypothetical protein
MRALIGFFLVFMVVLTQARAQSEPHWLRGDKDAAGKARPESADVELARWQSDLILAIRRKDAKTAGRMIRERAEKDGVTFDPDKDVKDNWALARTKFYRYVNFLADGETPLTAAINSGHVSLVLIMLELGADPNAPLKGGRTPLEQTHFAHNLELAKGYREGEREGQRRQRELEARQKYNLIEANLRAFGAKETAKLPKIELTNPTERLRDVLRAIELGNRPWQVRQNFFSGEREKFVSFREKELMETYLGWLGPSYLESYWECADGVGGLDYVKEPVKRPAPAKTKPKPRPAGGVNK